MKVLLPTWMTEKLWMWKGGSLHRYLAYSEGEYSVILTLCGRIMHDPKVYRNYRKIPLFIRKQYCKRCRKKEKRFCRKKEKQKR